MDRIYERRLTRGNYDTSFNLTTGAQFPSNEVLDRNKVYRFNKKLYSGEYAYNKKIVVNIDDVEVELDYKCMALNRFKLVVDKEYGLIVGNDATIQTGDVHTDKLVISLVERTAWLRDIYKAIRICCINGSAIIKTGRNGISVLSPLFGYKVVCEHDKNKVKGYVLHELIYDEHCTNNTYTSYTPRYIRIIISSLGYEYERVYEYKGSNKVGTLGRPVKYTYNGREIPPEGRYYYTNVEDCETVQWLDINTEKDGLYGASVFDDLKDLVFAIENRMSVDNYILDQHGKPILMLGMQYFSSNEKTGSYSPAIINGKYLRVMGQDGKPEYLTWDGKLSESRELRADMDEYFYELSEMNKAFLIGDYKGNVSEESLNNMIKSAIDKANRDLGDMWYEIRKSLYMLCKLNNIDVNIEDININFNIGRVDDTREISEICKTLNEIGLFSKRTLLGKFFGYSEDDALAEFERIQLENNNNLGGLSNGKDEVDGHI